MLPSNARWAGNVGIKGSDVDMPLSILTLLFKTLSNGELGVDVGTPPTKQI